MTESALDFAAAWPARAHAAVSGAGAPVVAGRIVRVVGQVLEATSLPVAVGEVCRVAADDAHGLLAQVVGFHERGIALMPLGELHGLHPGAGVIPLGRPFHAIAGAGLVGRVLDGLGRPLDGRGPLGPVRRMPLAAEPPPALARPRIQRPFVTGVRAIDGLLTLGVGQRVGIMAGSGVGKSVLLGMMARHASADVNVIALLGERGREVREFIERDLGEDGMRRSVVIVATSDQPAVVRAAGALVATAVAEYFRDRGQDVMLLMDSVTRVAMAWREMGLSVGEPPTTKGYPPSVFAQLPRLLERAGTARRGSITGLYTVLVDGDDFNEPIADAARSILDGHIVLTRRLANARHFPAIDVLDSISRVRDEVTTAAEREDANEFMRLEAAWRANEDLIAVGAYKPGADARVDAAVTHRAAMLAVLQQTPEEASTLADVRRSLAGIIARTRDGVVA